MQSIHRPRVSDDTNTPKVKHHWRPRVIHHQYRESDTTDTETHKKQTPPSARIRQSDAANTETQRIGHRQQWDLECLMTPRPRPQERARISLQKTNTLETTVYYNDAYLLTNQIQEFSIKKNNSKYIPKHFQTQLLQDPIKSVPLPADIRIWFLLILLSSAWSCSCKHSSQTWLTDSFTFLSLSQVCSAHNSALQTRKPTSHWSRKTNAVEPSRYERIYQLHHSLQFMARCVKTTCLCKDMISLNEELD